ncbi:MAG: tRNA (adenosine(37)-N6)-dimethylallyltransferase MiaA [bacterium]
MALKILCIAGPTASGKSARAVEEALARDGEIISVDSRQVYRGLDIGTEKITKEEMRGIPHYLIDIRNPSETYSAGDFVADVTRLIAEISGRGRLPILVGGTHFYFDALLRPIAEVDANPKLRAELENLSTEELYARVRSADARRASELDPKNRRRLIRALEIVDSFGTVPTRQSSKGNPCSACSAKQGLPLLPDVQTYDVEWIIIDPPKEELQARIDARLESALKRGLIDEVRYVREKVGDIRLNELGLEYKFVGEFLRECQTLGVGRVSNTRCLTLLLPVLSAKLWQYARRQKAWLRKLGHPMS